MCFSLCSCIIVYNFQFFFIFLLFLASSNFGNGVHYMFDFNDGRFKVFPSQMVRRRWGEIVISYLQSRLQTEPGDISSLRHMIYTTRSIRNQIRNLGIALKVQVKIQRDLSLETFLITTPRTPIMVAPVQLRQTLPNVPIGARGRKRNEKSLLYIGVAPNPDNRQPAKRTYARLASTPSGGNARTQCRLLSTPLPPLPPSPPQLPNNDNLLPTGSSRSPSQLVLNFDDNLGSLNYSGDSNVSEQ